MNAPLVPVVLPREIASRSLRIAVLRSDAAHSAYVESLLAQRFQVVAAVVVAGRDERRALWRRGRRGRYGWRAYHDLRQRATGRAAQARRFFGPITHLDPATRRWQATSINSPVTREALAASQPDVTVVSGTGYLRSSTLSDAGLTINVHGGYLPRYRGNHGIFFAFTNGDFASLGASLHLVTDLLDAGPLLGVVRPALRPGDHDGVLYCRAIRCAAGLLCDLLAELEAGQPLVASRQDVAGRTFRHRDRRPVLEITTYLRRRSGRLRVPEAPMLISRPATPA